MDRDEAELMTRNDESDIKIYTDGSSHDGGVGASAVLLHGIRPARIARFYLGKDFGHTVYESECVDQILRLKMLQKYGQDLNGMDIMIATDNQAVLRAYGARKPRPESYLIEEARKIHESIEDRWPNVRLKMQWTPGDEGIEGNKKCDLEAKRAAEGEHRNRRINTTLLENGLPNSKPATRQHLKRKAKREYENDFRRLPRYERVARFDPKAPASNFKNISAKLNRQQASILMQLRTGHVPPFVPPVQAYLHRFNLAETPTCPSCGIEPETVTHYLLYCESHNAHRRRLRRTLGRDLSLEIEILGDDKHMKALMEYIDATCRMGACEWRWRKMTILDDDDEDQRRALSPLSSFLFFSFLFFLLSSLFLLFFSL